MKQVILALGLMLFAAEAEAAVVTHDFTVAGTIDGGGTVSGSFSLTGTDFSSGSGLSFSNVNVTVVGASDYYGQVFGDSVLHNGREITEDNSSNIGASIQFLTLFGGGANLNLNFLYPSGGSIITTTPSQFSESFYHDNDTGQDFAVQGAVTLVGAVSPAPEPAAWAMMIVGFGMVGSSMRNRKVAVRFS